MRIFLIFLTTSLALAFAASSANAASVGDEVRAQLREHLKNPQFALDGKPEYVITEPAYVEAALDQALKYVDLKQALSPEKLQAAKGSAQVYYRNGQSEPAGLRALEALIAKRFANPVASFKSLNGGTGSEWVELDFGWMVGPLSRGHRHRIAHDYFQSYNDSPERNAQRRLYYEGRGPATAQLARRFVDAIRAYPKAARISLLIKFPNFVYDGSALRATYYRAGWPESQNGWVVVTSATSTSRRGSVWVKNGDFSPYIDGRFSFYIDCNPTYARGRPPRDPAEAARMQEKCLNHAEGVF